MAIKRTKQTINKESMFNKIMPSLSKDEDEEEFNDSAAESTETAKKTTKKSTSAATKKTAAKKTATKKTSAKKTAEADESAEEEPKKTTKKTTTKKTAAKKTAETEAETEETPKKTTKKTTTKKTAAKKTAEAEAEAEEASAKTTKKTTTKKKTTAKKAEETDAEAEEAEEKPKKTTTRKKTVKKAAEENIESETETEDISVPEPTELTDEGIVNDEIQNSDEKLIVPIDQIPDDDAVSDEPENKSEDEIKTDEQISDIIAEELDEKPDTSVPKVSAYARQLVERKDDRDNGDYSEYEVININEELMKTRFNEIFDKFHCCHCNGCRFTVMALSLNLLEAKYIAVKTSERDDIIKNANDSHIKATIIQAILKIMINPIH